MGQPAMPWGRSGRQQRAEQRFISRARLQAPLHAPEGQLEREVMCKLALLLEADLLQAVPDRLGATGAVRARYDYDPYGRVTKLAGDMDATFGFTGFHRHQASGLNLTLHRAYDAETGRWLSRDPIAEEGGLNLYGYVDGDPINRVDPLGLQGVDCASLNARIDVLNKLFFSGSRDLNDQLAFQYSSAATLYWVDRAIDTASGVTGGAVGSAVKGAAFARGLEAAHASLPGKLVFGGSLSLGRPSLLAKIANIAEAWSMFGVYGSVSGGAANNAIKRTGKPGTNAVRSQIQDTADSMGADLDNLARTLSELRHEYRDSCCAQ